MRFSLKLDHLVVTARSLDEGINYVEAVLGVKLSPGGQHPLMGTHNMLLSLGPHEYLEVIAIDSDAPPPAHRRWFNMDNFDNAPRVTNWVCRTDDLDTALGSVPPGMGHPVELTRGDMSWTMAIPEFGRLPFDDAVPALIEWGADSPHPSRRLPDIGARLTRLDVFHPDAEALLTEFPALHGLEQVSVLKGPEKRLIANISTPDGHRVLV